MPRLQVRQLILSAPGDDNRRRVTTEFEWTDVRSPEWLTGFMLPYGGWAYEFRNAPEGS